MPKYLVADDAPVAARLLGQALDRLGDPVVVLSGEEAIAALRASLDFAFLLLDVHLGDGPNGFDVEREARALGYRGTVFFISGRATSEFLDRADELGRPLLSERFHIEKPIGREALRRRILRHARVPIDADDPRLVAEIEGAGILSPVLRAMLVGLISYRKKEDLLRELDMTKEAWHRASHRILVKLGMRGRSLRRAAMRLRRRVLAQHRAEPRAGRG